MRMIADFPVPNTLKLTARAALGGTARTEDDLRAAQRTARHHQLTLTPLGAGSNIIPAGRVAGAVVVVSLRGFEVLTDQGDDVLIRIGAGENWHATVMRTLNQGWNGLENLALIPGAVGAAPVQNIGAYGVELATRVEAVEVMDADGRMQHMTHQQCGFAYRDSVFKRRPELIITALHLRLSRRGQVVTTYPDLRDVLEARGISEPAPIDVANAVISVRQGKLPDPAVDPNVGSVFKNPVVDPGEARALAVRWPELKTFESGSGVKLSAAQLIDLAGWKVRAAGAVRCWPRQPLVLVNHGATDAREFLLVADALREDIRTRYQVELELEPSVLS